MKLEQYIPLARRTLKELPYAQHIDHMALGVIGELGEFADGLKKFLIYGKGVDPAGAKNEDGTVKALSVKDGGVLDKINLMEEGGDAFWYIVGLLPELDLQHDVLQGAFDHGFVIGRDFAGANAGGTSIIAPANAQIAMAVYNLLGFDQPVRTIAFSNMQIIGKNMGLLYGFFGLDLATSLDRNIAKLAKRYGDKFSDVAALNRDLAGERKVLEDFPSAGATGPAAGFTGTGGAGLNTPK